jgi:hypothetical protein
VKGGGRTAFSFILLAAAALILLLSMRLGPTARMVPLAVAIPTLALMLLVLALDLAPSLGGRLRSIDERDPFRVKVFRKKSGIGPEPGEAPPTAAGEIVVFLWLLFLVVSIYLLGFTAAAACYTYLFLRFRSGESRGFSLGMAAGTGLFIHGVFGIILGARLHEGLLWRWLGI